MNDDRIESVKNRIIEFERPDTIILFGSYAKGMATERSDVDILVVGHSSVPRRRREIELRKRLFGSGLSLDLRVLTPDEFSARLQQGSRFLQEVISTGRIIYQRR